MVDHKWKKSSVAKMMEIRGNDEELRTEIGVRVRVRVRVLRKDRKGIGGDDEGVARVEMETWSR